MSPGVNINRRPSAHAIECLRIAAKKPYPCQEINFTVRDKLIQFGLAELFEADSPYKTHARGRKVLFLRPTNAGLEFLNKSAKAENEEKEAAE